MIRVVLDTNIIVSALLQPLGPPAQVFELCLGGALQLCASGDIYAEYEEVISRPRFGRREETIAETLRAVREKGYWVRPTVATRACADPDDNMFLECAATAGAQYLVTGNLKHFPASLGETRIVTARWLLDIVAQETRKSPPE